ncbi:MAG: glycosyltransferase family 39 protein [Bacteroidota bacterium]
MSLPFSPSPKRTQSILNGVIFFIAGCLIIYTAWRAAILSMTHDESSTFINYIDWPVWSCFFDPACWGTANMHILNTWLMQISVSLFGDTPLFIRLPNVLGHLLYLTCSLSLVRKISKDGWIRLSGFLILNGNPYLLDFFSLARGYGLACAFMMMSLYFLYKFLDKVENKHLLLTLIGAILSVLSNFTFLNYLAILFAVLISFSFFSFQKRFSLPALPKSQHLFIIGSILGITFMLAFLLATPVQTLSKLEEFRFGVSDLHQTYRVLVLDSLYSQGYFSASTQDIFAVVTGAIGLIALGIGFSRIRQLGDLNSRWFFAVCLMLILLILGLLTQYYLLGTQYLVRRKALILIILLSLPAVSLIEFLRDWKRPVGLGLSVLISLFFLLHFSRSASPDLVREWYYDRYNRKIVQMITAENTDGNQASLGLDWIFNHSFLFYQETGILRNFKPILVESDIRSDTHYQFYYIQPSKAHLLHPDYKLIKQFGNVSALYKRSN